MRVAMLAAECEPWAKTGGLADVVDALARALGELGGDGVDDAGRRLPAALPGRARAGRAIERDDGRCASRTRARRSGSSTVTDRRRRRPTAIGCGWSTIRPAFDRDGLLRRRGRRLRRTTPGGSGCSAAPRSRRSGRTGGRSTCSTSTTGTPGRRRSTATCATRTTRSSAARRSLMTLHNLAYHGWTPRTRRSASSGWRRATASSRPTPTASTCCCAASSAAELVNTVSPGFARGGADARVRDGPRRRCCARKGDRFIGILNGLDTTVWDPATDADLAAPYSRGDRTGKAACRADLLTPDRVRSGRRRAGHRDDRAARPAEGLRPARRRRADAARARRPARRPGQRPSGARRSVPRDRAGAPRTGSRSSSGSIG